MLLLAGPALEHLVTVPTLSWRETSFSLLISRSLIIYVQPTDDLWPLLITFIFTVFCNPTMFSITHSLIQKIPPTSFWCKKKKQVILQSKKKKGSSKVTLPVRIMQFTVLSSGISENIQKRGNFLVHKRDSLFCLHCLLHTQWLKIIWNHIFLFFCSSFGW